MSVRLLTIDPGVHHAGAALWDGSDLVRALRIEEQGDASSFPLIDAIYSKFRVESIDRAVIEMPRTYGGRSARGDTDDLLALARVVGELRYGFMHLFSIAAPIMYEPSQWKGQTTKEVTENRCKVILRKEELACVQLPKGKKERTEVWDAIGMGIFHLGRKG